jgi:peptide/nickel transport system permease protein
MQQYIIRRVLLMIPTLLIVSLVVFSLVRVMPGDVVLNQLAQAPGFRQEDVDALRDQLGLNEPFFVQYVKWLGGVVRGDLGESLWSHQNTGALIADRIPVTLELAVLSFLIANSLALTLGILAATHQDGIVDYVLRLISITGLSIPNFWVATLVIVLGSRWFGYLPPLTYVPFSDDPMTNLEQFLIPAVIISIAASATIMRLVRSSMLEVLRHDYIRTARSKGLTRRMVIYRHGLRNALLPVVTVMGFQLGGLLTGSVIIEVIFSLPGLGRLTYDAILARDYTQVQANTLVFGALYLIINLLVDLSYAWIDPRIKYA